MLYRKQKNINELKANELVKDLFVVRFKKPIEKTKTGNYYFSLKVQDGYSSLMLKYWGSNNQQKIKEVFDSIKPDDIILVEGQVKEFNEQLELNVNEGNLKVLKQDEYDIHDFIRKSTQDTEEMTARLLKEIDLVQDKELKLVLKSFFDDPVFLKKFKYAPAAMHRHHGWISGLLEHTLSVMEICKSMLEFHKNLNKDLLIAGAILHDIGKIKEFEVTSQIKVSEKGMLLGHITLGLQMLSRKLDSLNVSETTKIKLLHIIVSHHGKLENGSIKQPMFPEALIIHKADELNAIVSQMIDFKEQARTEDKFIYSKDLGNIWIK